MQFTAVPWLRDHVQARSAPFLAATDVDPAALAERLQAAAAAADGAVGRVDAEAPRAARSSRWCRPRRSGRSSTGSPR